MESQGQNVLQSNLTVGLVHSWWEGISLDGLM